MAPVAYQPLDELWATLTAAAVLGVERRPFATPQLENELGAALAALDSQPNERLLLSAAALVGAWRRAGSLPSPSDPTLPARAPAEDLPVCSPRATQHLQAMLRGTHSVLLIEWLSLLADANKRVSPALLPAVLDAGAARSALRPIICRVQGARGRWLAMQNPAWEYAADLAPPHLSLDPAALEDAWQTGSRATRRAILEALRPTAPDMARAMIEATWNSERAENRAALLEMLAINLSMADEPFLEAALDDRSKEVRANAVDLLVRLPQSRLVQRMIDRLETLMHWLPPEKPRFLGLLQSHDGQLTVFLPDACDKAMIRDGVDPKPPRGSQGLGERAQWLMQMLQSIPPAHWSDRWRAAPDKLITAAEESEWAAAVLPAWVTATWRARDVAWAEALLQRDPSRDGLLEVLPIDRQEALLKQILTTLDRPLSEHPVLGLLRRTRHTWRMPLARQVLAAVRKQMTKWAASRDYALYSALPEFALRLPPELLAEVSAGWRSHAGHEQWQGAIDRMLVTFQFRCEMLQALQE